MAVRQLRLLPAPQPLLERLGVEFFRTVPAIPGVYRMFDHARRLLYVGKAKDLRSRLSSYRRTSHQSRKTIRLIHATSLIEWEPAPNETAARLRENELIRTLRPRFNRMGTWPGSARFVRVTELPDAAGFCLELTSDPDGESYGAFRAPTAQALGALARLSWLAWNQTSETSLLPHALVRREALPRFTANDPRASSWLEDVRVFLAGDNDLLKTRFLAEIPEPASSFDALFAAAQFEILREFFRRGPWRNARLRAALGLERRALAPEEQDDLLVLFGTTPP
jgi:excinuclease ABC subunit C